MRIAGFPLRVGFEIVLLRQSQCLQPPQHVHMAACFRAPSGGVVAGAAIGNGPLQQLQMTARGSVAARVLVPETVTLSSPLQYMQMAAFGRQHAGV